MLFQRDRRIFGGKISKWFRQPVPEDRQSQFGRTRAEELDKGCLSVPGSGEASKALPRPAQHTRSTEQEQPSVFARSSSPRPYLPTSLGVFCVQTDRNSMCWMCTQWTGTSCSSVFLNNNRERLNAGPWDESFRFNGAPQRAPQHCGTCGILILFLSYTAAQEPFATFMLLLYQKMLPSSAGEGGLTAFFGNPLLK